ncbi:MAG: hypothetical protein ACOX83_10710 [Candidatus Spyradocola sp.]|jgi:hypothetical protein
MTPTLKYPGVKWRTVAERGVARVECLWLNPRAEEGHGKLEMEEWSDGQEYLRADPP